MAPRPFSVLVMAAASILLALQLHNLIVLTYSSSWETIRDIRDKVIELPKIFDHSSEMAEMLTSTSIGSGDSNEHRDHESLPAAASPKYNSSSSSRNNNSDSTNENEWEPLPWSLPNVEQDRIQSSEDFMNDLNELKRSMNTPLPWDNASGNFSLPTPIIGLNLPKSGTLTLAEFFKCGGVTSAHTWIPYSRPQLRIGDCMRDNFLSGAAPFEGCNVDNRTKSVIEFYSDIGIGRASPRCFYSSLHDGGLDHIAEHYPNATILLMSRDFDAWFASIRKWAGGNILKRWREECGIGTCGNADRTCWRDFYHAHTLKIREFARSHLGLTYMELPLDASSPSALESYTGISASCFQHCRPGKPKDPNIDLRTYRKCKPISSWHFK